MDAPKTPLPTASARPGKLEDTETPTAAMQTTKKKISSLEAKLAAREAARLAAYKAAKAAKAASKTTKSTAKAAKAASKAASKASKSTANRGKSTPEASQSAAHTGSNASAAKESGASSKQNKKRARDPSRPKRPKTAFFCFLAAVRERVAEKHKDLKITERSKLMGQMWKALDADGRKKYIDEANEDKERFTKEMATYKPLSREDLEKQNLEQEQLKKRRKKKKDPAAPKGKRSAYILFCNEIRTRVTEENKSLKMTEISKLMALEWKQLHDEGKQKFKDLALQDKVRYEEEMKKYTPPPSAVGDVSDNSAKQNKERVTGKGKKSKRATKNQSSSEKSAKKTTRPTKTQSSAQKKTKPANKKLNTLFSFFAKRSNKAKPFEAEAPQTTEEVNVTPEEDFSVVSAPERDDAPEDEAVEADATGSETNNLAAEDSEDDEDPVISKPQSTKRRRVIMSSESDSDEDDDHTTTSIASPPKVTPKTPQFKRARVAPESKLLAKAPKPLAARASTLKKTDTSAAVVELESVNDWEAGASVPYAALAAMFKQVEQITARLKITEIVREFFRKVIFQSPQDLLVAVHLTLNKIAPEYEGCELGIGDSIIMKALQQSTGRNMKKLRADIKERGDMGEVAETSRASQTLLFKPKPLTVQSVFKAFTRIAKTSGAASVNAKSAEIKKLLVASQGHEARYIVRGLQGKLRIHLGEGTVVVALAHAFAYTPPHLQPPVFNTKPSAAAKDKAESILKQALSEYPNWGKICSELQKRPMKDLPAHVHLTPGIPVKPMLAKPTTGISEILDRFAKTMFTSEYKYDGERAQIHKMADGSVKIFSRGLENSTAKYPDVCAEVGTMAKDGVNSFILDSEVVAWDRDKNVLLPFQQLSTRGKKDVKLADVKVNVIIFAFDLLELNGKSVIHQSFAERRKLLHNSFREKEGIFKFATFMNGKDTEEINEFLAQSIKDGCEGLMIKTLEQNASYEPSKRSLNWLKLKKDYIDGCGDSLDLVPLAAWRGKGKRTGNFGAYLLACYDEDEETYQSVCKIGTGFTDEMLQHLTNTLKPAIIDGPKSYYAVPESLEPDVWFEAVSVWECKCADLSVSPCHKAAVGHVDPSKGIALRFPRFLRVREDKSPENATSATQVADMYRAQSLT